MATSLRVSKSGAHIAKAYEYFLSTHINHVANEYHGDPFMLEPWQRKYIWDPVFGSGSMVTRGGKKLFQRRTRRFLLGMPRDGGKSETAIAMLLTIANMEPVYEGEYAVIASSKPQAKKAFGKLKSMIVQNPDLHAMWEVMTDMVVNRETNAKIMVLPYSEAATQSYHFNVVICDEAHVYKNLDVLEAVISGQKNIFNALCIVTTTAGPRREGALWDTIALWKEDPASYVYWLGASDTDDITSEATWKKVSPMSWVTLDAIRDQFNSTRLRAFERYTMNRFPLGKGEERAFTPRQIARCVKQPSQFDITKGWVLGIDGAQNGDAFALVAIQRNGEYFDAFEWVYDDPPEDTGYYDLVAIERLIAEMYSKYRPLIGLDPSRLLLMFQHLKDEFNVDALAVKQANEIMCPATSLVVKAVKSGKLRLGANTITGTAGCPKTADHLSNATVLSREPWGERFGKFSQSREDRIDAAIGLAIAMFLESTQERRPSFAESGGFQTVRL